MNQPNEELTGLEIAGLWALGAVAVTAAAWWLFPSVMTAAAGGALSAAGANILSNTKWR